jgi:hypothetical protein
MELKWPDLMPVWWGFFWRSMVYMFGVGVILFSLAALFGVQNGAGARTVLTVGTYVGWLPVSMLAIKNALEDRPPKFAEIAKPPAA